MKQITLKLPENKKEFIEWLKQDFGNEITIKENNQHYLIYDKTLIEAIIFIHRFGLVIKVYRNGNVAITKDLPNKFEIIEQETSFAYGYIIILKETGKL